MDRTNSINTWRPGRFIDSKEFAHMPDAWKDRRRNEESHLVRPSPKGNAICWCNNPEDAKWIADRLNVAANLEKQVSTTHKDKLVRGG